MMRNPLRNRPKDPTAAAGTDPSTRERIPGSGMRSPSTLTRRAFLQMGPLLACGTLVQAQESAPSPAVGGDPGTHSGGGAHGPLPSPHAAALRAKAGRLKGLDPARFLTAFDTGTVSRMADGRTLREYTLRAVDAELEVAPGVFFRAWTYNGTVPGPTLRCREGDRLRVRFVNDSLAEHTIHFHGVHPAGMDGVGPVVDPGGTFVYEFDAEPAGLHPYHCHAAPVPLHMNRGLFGCMIVDPAVPRPPATEMVMVLHGWDTDFDGRNELYACNGPANAYRDAPIRIRVGERVRLYLVNLLEHDPINSFHLHANIFDLRRTGVGAGPAEATDVVTLSQAERCIIEFAYRFPGTYMFHAHQNLFAELGWMGHFEVGG